MKFKPLKDKVLVKPSESEEKTSGGIYIPDTAKDKTQEGIVVAVGEGEYMPLKVGNKVIYESFAGTEITIKGEKHLIMNIKDVLGMIED
ncbi:MAG: co-chaperone GroES [Nanoarchaeota archaeon]